MEWTSSTTRLAALLPLTVVAVDIIRRFFQSRLGRKRYPLPPGPTPLPLIGSVLSVNTEEPWLTYTEWRAKYGDIVYARLLDSDVIILNSPTVATDLLEKRSQIYSDRPFVATVDPYGHDSDFAFARYGDHWRLCRRIFHQTFRAEASVSFRPMQLRRARQVITNIIDEPNEYPFHFATFSAAVAMSAVWDYEPSPRNDPMVSIINTFLQISFPALTTERSFILKAFPFLLHIPDWLPGSFIKRQARESRMWSTKMLNTPFEYVQKRLGAKEHMNTAMVPDHITRMAEFGESRRLEYETALKHAAATAFIGSSTSSALSTFTLAMVQNPHIWRRAQAEIDAAVGTDRLPEFDDRPNLPYVEAIVRETSRWIPVSPLAIPHATTTSDVYKDYYIPKGATIISNAWGMSRDETRYPDPDKFKPERFLDTKGILTDDDPAEFVFGFGRRICPGRHTADASVWSSIVTMLATLDFNLAKDADGKDITFTPTFSGGLSLHPHPFPCALTPRTHISRAFLEHVLAA